MEYIQDLLRKYGPSLKIKQLSLNFDDAVYQNDGIIGHNDLLFVFMELFDVPGGCFVGTTGFFVSGTKKVIEISGWSGSRSLISSSFSFRDAFIVSSKSSCSSVRREVSLMASL